MRRRKIESREFLALVSTAYPVATGLTPGEIGRWLQHRILSPLVKLKRAWIERRTRGT